MTNIYEARVKKAQCERRLERAVKKYEESGKEMWKKIADDQKLLIAGYTSMINRYENKYGLNK